MPADDAPLDVSIRAPLDRTTPPTHIPILLSAFESASSGTVPPDRLRLMVDAVREGGLSRMIGPVSLH